MTNQGIYIVLALVALALILNNNLNLKAKYYHSQIMPHAILNSLVFLQTKILKTEKVLPIFFDYQTHYLKKILQTENKLTCSLKEELENTIEFISYFNLVNNTSYIYEVIWTNQIKDRVLVPNLLLQPFIENIFKHSKNSEGCILISITINDTFFNQMMLIDLKLKGHEQYNERVKISKNSTGLYFAKSKIYYTCLVAAGRGVNESDTKIYRSNNGNFQIKISMPTTLVQI